MKSADILTALIIHHLYPSCITGFTSNANSRKRSRLSVPSLEESTADDSRNNVKSPFQRFEDEVLERIAIAQRSDERNALSKSPGQIDAPLILGQEYLERLAIASSDNDSDKEERIREERKSLARKVRERGGYFVLELGENEASIIERLWTSTEEIFDVNEPSSNVPFRHQTLVREGTSAASEARSGYKYIETTMRRSDGAFIPDRLAEQIGKERKQIFSNAYELLGNIGKLVVSTLFKGSVIDVADRDIDNLMQTLPDDGTISAGFLQNDNESELCCSMHRICKYAALPEADDVDEKETLRGHTDWTLATLVPVSLVTGLEIWEPRATSWVRPELYFTASPQNESTTTISSNSRYVVVMAGKWLELLAKGYIHATIHRVIAAKGEARHSTPFFYRPRQQIPLCLQARYGKIWKDDNSCKEENVVLSVQEEMGDFLFSVGVGPMK